MKYKRNADKDTGFLLYYNFLIKSDNISIKYTQSSHHERKWLTECRKHIPVTSTVTNKLFTSIRLQMKEMSVREVSDTARAIFEFYIPRETMYRLKKEKEYYFKVIHKRHQDSQQGNYTRKS
jgi:hypothetical protein